jgi:hypothetical protein
MEDDHRRQHDVDQNVVDGNDDSRVDSEGLDGQDFAEGVCHESATGGARSDGYSLRGLPEGVGQPLSEAPFELLDLLALSPGIDDDKNVIASDSQNDEDHQVVDRDEEADSKDVLVDKLSNWERKQDHQNGETRQKERLQVDQEV